LGEYNFLISFGWVEISVISASLVPAGICGDPAGAGQARGEYYLKSFLVELPRGMGINYFKKGGNQL
jgi:hypothetical protein